MRVQGLTAWTEQSWGCAPRCPASQSESPQVPPLHRACLSFPPPWGSGRTCVGGWNPWVEKEPLGLWLQIPGQMTEHKHQFPARVRLPRSLFASLQGSRPMVPLAVSVLDVGRGNLFKVRCWVEGRAALRLPRQCSSSGGVFLEEPPGDGEAKSLCSSRPPQTRL